jgi:ParB family chromosome partitioning protein
MSSLISVNGIKVHNRIRKDYGNIDELAQSIKEHGLLQPIVVTPDYVLIAGERRLLSVKKLGWKEILATIKTAEDREEQLLCEIAENENRKDFTYSERIAYGLELEQIERLKARERQATSTGGKNAQPRVNRPQPEQKGKTDEIVGKKVGMSYPSYRRAKRVVESGNKELIEKMDKGEIGVATAYNQIKGKGGKPVTPKPTKLETKEKEDIKKEVPSTETSKNSLPISLNHIRLLVNNFLADADRYLFMPDYVCQLTKEEKVNILEEIEQVKDWYEKFKQILKN